MANGVRGHTPHDSALDVGALREKDVARIRDLEEEVKRLTDRANADCKYLCSRIGG